MIFFLQTSMAADSHKELQKSGRFGHWVRKDIQYSQFQNYELTYAHFIRAPLWERSPPGLSPGVNWGLAPQYRCMQICSLKSSNIFFALFLLLVSLLFPTSTKVNYNPPNKNQDIRPTFNDKGQIIFFPQPVTFWTASNAISWLVLANFRQSIQNRLICAQWKAKISWLTVFSAINLVSTTFQHHGMSILNSPTTCDRWLDSKYSYPHTDAQYHHFFEVRLKTFLKDLDNFHSWLCHNCFDKISWCKV